jgi:ribosomal protein L29
MDKMATTVRTLQKELADLRTQLQAKTDPAA